MTKTRIQIYSILNNRPVVHLHQGIIATKDKVSNLNQVRQRAE